MVDILVTSRAAWISSFITTSTPSSRTSAEAATLSQSRSGSGSVASIPHFFRLDFAYSIQTVLYVMAGIMAAAAIVAILGLRRGVQEELPAAQEARAEVVTD